jgi:arylsulfatase A
MDLFPTILDYANIPLPTDVVLDGISIRNLLSNDEGTAVQDPHECIYFWREHTLYAIRCGQYKGHFITRSGFNFTEAPLLHSPPLLFNIEWDPSEAIPLDTSLPEYALEAEYLQKQADIHISSIVAGPSQYLAQNYSRVPCCPRGKSDGLFHFENIDNLTSVSESTTAVGGPWADCICQRITI